VVREVLFETGLGNVVNVRNSRQSRSLVSVLLRQDFVGGVVVIAIAVFAFWQGADLPIGTFGGMGPGMLPRGLAVLLGLLGVLLAVDAVLEVGLPLERWSLRGPVLVLGAVVAFGLAVRPLGLLVAGPLAIVIAAFASDEVHWGETILFGALMTAFCIGLFKFALGLPIPLAPWLIGY
jgi:putative tricarboxylic transport membrane protein